MELYDVIEGALKDFQSMWADIGYSEEDQERAVKDFIGSITHVCTTKVEQLREEKVQMTHDVALSIEQIKKLAAQLDDGEVELVRRRDTSIHPSICKPKSLFSF
jgi:uncharacterized protein (UPF0305 family)